MSYGSAIEAPNGAERGRALSERREAVREISNALANERRPDEGLRSSLVYSLDRKLKETPISEYNPYERKPRIPERIHSSLLLRPKHSLSGNEDLIHNFNEEGKSWIEFSFAADEKKIENISKVFGEGKPFRCHDGKIGKIYNEEKSPSSHGFPYVIDDKQGRIRVGFADYCLPFDKAVVNELRETVKAIEIGGGIKLVVRN
jgi:hypothetical protein